MLNRGDSVSEVARTLCCARSSVGRWINWFTLYGTDGLKSLPPDAAVAGLLRISARFFAS
nr:helix-turn-helix domain-containing protein [Rahnella sikkimica]